MRFSLKAGCGLDGLLKYTNRLTVTTTSSGFVLSEYTNDLKKNRLLLNGMGGVCVEFSLGTHTIIMEGYYCRSGSLVQTETHASLDGFKLSIGMFL